MIKRAKESFQEKIQILLTGKSSQELQQIKAIQEEIISLTEKRQELNDELNEENIESYIIPTERVLPLPRLSAGENNRVFTGIKTAADAADGHP